MVEEMCNLYNISTNQQAICEIAGVLRDLSGNLREAYDVFPDYAAPVVRVSEDGAREMILARWGLPNPPGIKPPFNGNIRNPKSPHWRRWMGIANRCVVPATSFCEYEGENGAKWKVWFALDPSEPVFFFAGVWTDWHGMRSKKEGEGDFRIYSFLTTEPNAVVAPVHPKAMPVLLTSPAEVNQWLAAPLDDALKLQRSLADKKLSRIVRNAA